MKMKMPTLTHRAELFSTRGRSELGAARAELLSTWAPRAEPKSPPPPPPCVCCVEWMALPGNGNANWCATRGTHTALTGRWVGAGVSAALRAGFSAEQIWAAMVRLNPGCLEELRKSLHSLTNSASAGRASDATGESKNTQHRLYCGNVFFENYF